jgi:hypothetical protein
MAILILDILDGKRALADLPRDLAAFNSLKSAMQEQQTLCGRVEKWTEREIARATLRRSGGHRYTGEPIKTHSSTGISDLFAQARSAGFAPMVAQQSLPASFLPSNV